jgi:hypothetical protein
MNSASRSTQECTYYDRDPGEHWTVRGGLRIVQEGQGGAASGSALHQRSGGRDYDFPFGSHPRTPSR